MEPRTEEEEENIQSASGVIWLRGYWRGALIDASGRTLGLCSHDHLSDSQARECAREMWTELRRTTSED